jgi:hypothetical protein
VKSDGKGWARNAAAGIPNHAQGTIYIDAAIEQHR